MKFVTFLCLLYSFCAAPMVLGQTSNCSTTDKKINKALEEANNATNFDDFVKRLAAVISKYPNNVQAYFYLGQIHYQQGMAMMPQNRNYGENYSKNHCFFTKPAYKNAQVIIPMPTFMRRAYFTVSAKKQLHSPT